MSSSIEKTPTFPKVKCGGLFGQRKIDFFPVINVNFAQMRDENKFSALQKKMLVFQRNGRLFILTCWLVDVFPLSISFTDYFVFMEWKCSCIKAKKVTTWKNAHLNKVLIFFKLLHACHTEFNHLMYSSLIQADTERAELTNFPCLILIQFNILSICHVDCNQNRIQPIFRLNI